MKNDPFRNGQNVQAERNGTAAAEAEQHIRRTGGKRKALLPIAAAAMCICIAAVVMLAVLLPGRDYRAALALYQAGELDGAISGFRALNGYRDSEALLDDCYRQKFGEAAWAAFQEIQVGDTYTFGAYEQDGDPSDGAEPIEWIVLDQDGLSLLLLSRQALECRSYLNNCVPVHWENSTVRQWLNYDFLNAAFSEEEQLRLRKTTVTDDRNPRHNTGKGRATEDFVFLLSIIELKQYTASNSDRQCTPTEAAAAGGAYTGDNGSCWWWLRSPGEDLNSAAFVSDSGAIKYGGHLVNDAFTCVRPALWVSLE